MKSRSFDLALKYFQKFNGRTIVEIGSIRHENPAASGGHSTLAWPVDATVWSVDIDPEATAITRRLTHDRSNVFPVLADGFQFLSRFTPSIDLLYLDCGFNKHAALYVANMAARSVLLVDDVDYRPEPDLEDTAFDFGYYRVELPTDCIQLLMVRE